jgi:hypothetical protein
MRQLKKMLTVLALAGVTFTAHADVTGRYTGHVVISKAMFDHFAAVRHMTAKQEAEMVKKASEATLRLTISKDHSFLMEPLAGGPRQQPIAGKWSQKNDSLLLTSPRMGKAPFVLRQSGRKLFGASMGTRVVFSK